MLSLYKFIYLCSPLIYLICTTPLLNDRAWDRHKQGVGLFPEATFIVFDVHLSAGQSFIFFN